MTLTTKRLAVAGSAVAALAALASRFPRRVTVEGDSMRPTFEPGDRLLLLPALRVAVGDLVGVVDPRDGRRLMVKRVAACPGGRALDGTERALEARSGYVVLGDNPDASTDSRHFGPVSGHLLRGRVVYRYWPEARRGRV